MPPLYGPHSSTQSSTYYSTTLLQGNLIHTQHNLQLEPIIHIAARFTIDLTHIVFTLFSETPVRFAIDTLCHITYSHGCSQFGGK